MNKHKKWPTVVCFILVCILFFVFGLHHQLLRIFLQHTINQQTKIFFNNSLRIEKAQLDLRSKIRINRIRAEFKSDSRVIPLEILSIESENPVFGIFSRQGLVFHFKGARPVNSKHKGMNGIVSMRGTKDWFLKAEVRVESLGLEDIEWINPDGLRGASGEFKVNVLFFAASEKEPNLTAYFEISKPGGRIQSRFFSLLLPYLPIDAKPQMQKIASAGGLVSFIEGDLELNTMQSDELKVLLHILVPDYNLNLNVNAKVRLDEKNAFPKLAQAMQLMRVRKN
jgi:hypothetical protein